MEWWWWSTPVLSGLEVVADVLDGLLVEAERLLQHRVAHGRVGREQRAYCSTARTSVARGCVWGTLMPPRAKSRRARPMPGVLRPGSCASIYNTVC
jgi:hypothetical protein